MPPDPNNHGDADPDNNIHNIDVHNSSKNSNCDG
jgi:hypothetical protein